MPKDTQIRWILSTAVVIERFSFRREVEPLPANTGTSYYTAYFQSGRHVINKDHPEFEKMKPKLEENKPSCSIQFLKTMVDKLDQKKEKLFKIAAANIWHLESVQVIQNKVEFKFKTNNDQALLMLCPDVKVREFKEEIFGNKATLLVPEENNY